MLLTMSAATGVEHLHRDFESHVRETMTDRLENPKSSVIGNRIASLQEHGAKDWYERTVEWFMVYLLSEVGCGPQNIYSGRSAVSLRSALHNTVQDLVRL